MQGILASLLTTKEIPTQVSESEWMDAATQERAAKKADQMLQLIGYPDWLTDPSKVILMTMMVMVMITMMVMMMMMMMTARPKKSGHHCKHVQGRRILPDGTRDFGAGPLLEHGLNGALGGYPRS